VAKETLKETPKETFKETLVLHGVELLKALTEASAATEMALIDKLESKDLMTLRMTQLAVMKEIYVSSLTELRMLALTQFEVEKLRLENQAKSLENQSLREARLKEDRMPDTARRGRWH